MKKVALVSAVLFVTVVSCNTQTTNGSEVSEVPEVSEEKQPTAEAVDENVGSFGAEIDLEGAIDASQVAKNLGNEDFANMKVEGTIVEVCQMKGCWMTMDIGGGKSMRITFKDYEFFVPKNASGYHAIMEGKAENKVVSVADLKHYAEDAGKSEEEIAAITEDEQSISFEAAGVIITGPAK